MFTLAVDASTKTASVAILENKLVRAEILINLGIKHSDSLLTAIRYIFDLARMKVDDINLLACAVGPGSFTGLRIAVSTIKGLASATGKPVVGVSTLEALALNIADSSLMICPMLDAKKGQVYTALYRADRNNVMLRISSDKAVKPEEFLSDIHGEVVFIGEGAFLYENLIRQMLPGRSFFTSHIGQCVRASSVGLLGLRNFEANEILNVFTFTPRYLRLSEAELKNKAIS